MIYVHVHIHFFQVFFYQEWFCDLSDLSMKIYILYIWKLIKPLVGGKEEAAENHIQRERERERETNRQTDRQGDGGRLVYYV